MVEPSIVSTRSQVQFLSAPGPLDNELHLQYVAYYGYLYEKYHAILGGV